MTSHHTPTPDVSRVRDTPLDRRTTSSSLASSTQRYSIGSSDAGESSAAASKRNSDATLNDDNVVADVAKDGKRGHRSHRSRNSVRSQIFVRVDPHGLSHHGAGDNLKPTSRGVLILTRLGWLSTFVIRISFEQPSCGKSCFSPARIIARQGEDDSSKQ
jgi:hypothetical protein